jgi:putative ABC transport system permease protein
MPSAPSWLDLKLGLRMLVKYPALSLVGGLGMAVATAVSVGFFAFMQAHLYPVLPLPEGERIVAIENRDTKVNNEVRQAVHDFVVWRQELRTITDVGAFRIVTRNIVAGDGVPEPIPVADMSAAGFTLARVAPAMGRVLSEADEAPGAPKVVVIGHDVWKNRFAGDPRVVGRELRLNGTPHTIVGVMPDGFAFPQDHEYWLPFQADPSASPRRKGPAIYIFGRLAPGISMEAAQAELAVLGKRAAADYPTTNKTIVPMVMPYTHSLTDIQGMTTMMAVQMQAMMSLLLLVVALNVAVLVYARTATRQGEIAVRSALGASRARIVRQLFMEGLVLSLVSSAVGLGIAQVGVGIGNDLMATEGGTPFWADYSVQPITVLFTIGAAVFTAIIVGVLPALQATGRRLTDSLRQVSAGSGTKLGKTWTTLIVAQVAIAAAALPAAVSMGWDEIRGATTRPTYVPSAFLQTGLRGAELYGEGGVVRVDTAQFGERVGDVMRRVVSVPNVLGVTYRASLAGRGGRVEVEGITLPDELQGSRAVESDGIALNTLDVFGVRTLSGRSFEPADTDTASTSVLVNRSFSRRVFGNENALGRRVRYAGTDAQGEDAAIPPSRWYSIVGVVEDMSVNRFDPDLVRPVLYYPVALGSTAAVQLEIHTRGKATDFIRTLRQHIVAVDPAMRLGQSYGLDEFERQDQLATRLAALVIGLVLLSVALLSGAGVYALTSFTVTRRRREIGIRTALGAQRGQVLRDIFGRVARQIAIGLGVGIGAAGLIEVASGGELLSGRGGVLLPTFGVLMAVVAVLAAVGPARRGLSIQPAEALRAEA